jgi:signal transduction histidine kinase
VSDLVNELAYASIDSAVDASAWLDRLRRVAYATEAVLWRITDGMRATAVLHAGTAAAGPASAEPGIDIRRTTVDRVQRTGLIACGVGETSGVEDFVPSGVSSFIVAGANRPGRLVSVLVLGWVAPLPSCGTASFGELRVAAALLDRALGTGDQSSAYGATVNPVIRSMDAGIAIVDRHGAIMAATARRAGPRDHDGGARGSRDAATSLELCQQAAKAGSAAAVAALEGIGAVAGGASDFFQTACLLPDPYGHRWTMMTATPLQPAGGAVVVHCDLVEGTIASLTQRFGDRRFLQILDALPLPVWIAGHDGRVTCASRRWDDAVDGGAIESSRPRQWLDAVHPDDRAGAASAFAGVVATRERMNVELRLRTVDGAYRWYSCLAEPLAAAEPWGESYLGVCIDISRQRQAQASREVLAAKLLATQEAERSRYARDLHDELGHQVVLLDAALDTALRQRWSRTQSVSTLRAARSKLQGIAASIHALAHRLHPAKLRLLGLEATLQTLCRDIAVEADKDVRFEARDVPGDIDETVAVSLFRITQEALQNTVKHSGACTITVQLSGMGAALRLRIADDGSGFDPLTVPSAGLGLMTMRERVELMGGTLAITTAPGQGTTIDVVVSDKDRGAG